jgi:hypothetical protein
LNTDIVYMYIEVVKWGFSDNKGLISVLQFFYLF